MNEQQRQAALRLADALPSLWGDELPEWSENAAALLRELASEPPNCGDFDKLTAEVEADPLMRPHLAAGREWVKTLAAEPCCVCGEPHTTGVVHRTDGPCYMAEPVAWQWLNTGTFRKSLPKTAVASDWNPLFAHPPQQRRPLSDEEINELWLKSEDTGDFARAIEKAITALLERHHDAATAASRL